MCVSDNQSSKNSIKRQRPDESDESSDADARQPIAQETSQSALNVPRFLVVHSKKKNPTRKVADLSPFVIEQCIVSLAGQII